LFYEVGAVAFFAAEYVREFTGVRPGAGGALFRFV
jgi:hypothetical protein